MTIKLVTDSTCDLPQHLIDALRIQVVPINIQFGATTYRENVTLSPDQFYHKVAVEGLLPQTSQPAVGDFVETYRNLAANGGAGADGILSIHLTSKLSGTYQSAKLAASMVRDQVKVTIIDSLAGSAGLGWMVYEAAQLIKLGRALPEIQTHLESKRDGISIFFAVDTLTYAQMSGRVGKLGSVLGTLLNIKPVIGLSHGLIDVTGKVRSRRAAMERIVALTAEKVQHKPVNVAVVHALAPDRAEMLLEQAIGALNVQETFVKDVAISLAVHFGPGTLGLIAYPME
jgi:DegV family protein with EDD domain